MQFNNNYFFSFFNSVKIHSDELFTYYHDMKHLKNILLNISQIHKVRHNVSISAINDSITELNNNKLFFDMLQIASQSLILSDSDKELLNNANKDTVQSVNTLNIFKYDYSFITDEFVNNIKVLGLYRHNKIKYYSQIVLDVYFGQFFLDSINTTIHKIKGEMKRISRYMKNQHQLL